MNTPKLTAWVSGANYFADGTPYGASNCHFTTQVDVKVSRLWWQTEGTPSGCSGQDKGLSYTASGYGKRIPTEYMVKYNGKWRRVYCRIYSNSGTLYIGKLPEFGERFYIRIDTE